MDSNTKPTGPNPTPDYTTLFTTTHRLGCRALAFSPDGRYIATGSQDTTMKILDTQRLVMQQNESSEERKVVRTLYDHTGAVNDIQFHPNGNVLASGSDDCQIKLFDMNKMHVKRAFRYLPDAYPIRSIRFHPSGDYLISGTDHHAVRIYDIHTMKCFIPSNPADNHNGGILNGLPATSIVFSKNSKYLLSTGMDSVGRLWDMTSGKVLVSYQGTSHQTDKTSMIFNYNEDYVVGSDDETSSLSIWDSRTGVLLLKLGGHTKQILAIASSPVDAGIMTGRYPLGKDYPGFKKPALPTKLELETRYLKSGGQHSLGAPKDMHGHDFMARNSHPHSQNTTETGLDIKELQSEFNAFKEKTRELELTLESVTKQYDEQTEEIAKLKDRHGIEKDKIYGELISIRKKYETATSECKRSELSYKRIVQENEQLERIASKSKEQENSTREKIDEQLQINKSLSNKVDELLQVNVTITAKLKKSESCEESKKALDRERKQETEQSQSDKKDIEDIEKQKYQLERLKGDYEMLKITMENKDRKISELQQQMELLETSNHKILETKNVLSEQILEMETRLHKNEIELTQVCQDKRLLTDDVAEIKIQLETVLARLSTATSKNNSLVIQIEKYKRDLDTLQKFASVLDQVETNGQNYLQLMRDMRKYLNTNE
ncbi:hypothetical protein BDV3_005853 [Batrachochytrium dendrobatidis]